MLKRDNRETYIRVQGDVLDGKQPPDSLVRARFTRGVEGLAALIAGLTPKVSKERRRRRALATTATLVGAVVLARAVDDEELANELLQAAQDSVTS